MIMIIFSVVSVLFMPPVVTGGLFGMNVRVPGQADVVKNLVPFFCILAIMVVWSGLLGVMLWKLSMVKSIGKNFYQKMLNS